MENPGAEAKEGLNEARTPAATSADVTAQAPAPADVTAQAPASADVTAQAPVSADVTAQAPALANVTAQAPAPRNVATLAPTSARDETPEADVKDTGKLSFPCFTRAIGTEAQFNGGSANGGDIDVNFSSDLSTMCVADSTAVFYGAMT